MPDIDTLGPRPCEICFEPLMLIVTDYFHKFLVRVKRSVQYVCL